jgi:hypothetical protein
VPTTSLIHGVVFNDANENGLWDDDESGIPDVTVALDGVDVATTDANGTYAFEVDQLGLHTIVESNPTGYVSTTPDEVQIDVTEFGVDYVADFGDAVPAPQSAIIFGAVFEDLDGDGILDSDEPRLSGVSITLDAGTMVTTDTEGYFEFEVNQVAAYLVTETDPAGYESTTPNEILVDVNTLGSDYQLDFGDALPLTPAEQITETIELLDDAVQSGDLEPAGNEKQADNRLASLISSLEAAQQAIADGNTEKALSKLTFALARCDGNDSPPDYVTGPAAEELGQMILDLIADLL